MTTPAGNSQLQEHSIPVTAENIPHYLKTQVMADGSLHINEAMPGDVPVYRLTPFTEANDLQTAITDFRADGTKIVRVHGIQERQAFNSDFGYEGHFNKFYIIPANGFCAFELEFQPHHNENFEECMRIP